MTKKAIISVITGASAGILGGLMGVGGGIIMVPMMVGLLGISQHLAHGTSLTAMILLGLSGSTQYMLHGYMDWPLVAELAAGSIIGVIIGAKVMMKLPARQLRRGFGILVLLVGLRMLWQ